METCTNLGVACMSADPEIFVWAHGGWVIEAQVLSHPLLFPLCCSFSVKLSQAFLSGDPVYNNFSCCRLTLLSYYLAKIAAVLSACCASSFSWPLGCLFVPEKKLNFKLKKCTCQANNAAAICKTMAQHGEWESFAPPFPKMPGISFFSQLNEDDIW